MAITKLSNSSVVSGTKYISMLAGNTYKPIAGAFESIATGIVGVGGQSSITFSSIPQTYTHLQIRYTAQNNRATFATDDVIMYFNSDTTTSHYQSHRFYGYGSSTVTGDAPNGIAGVLAGFMYTTAGGANSSFGAGIIDIPDYTSTSKNKTIRALSGADNNGGINAAAGQTGMTSGLWNTTPAAITNIVITPGNGSTFSQYTKFALYGVK